MYIDKAFDEEKEKLNEVINIIDEKLNEINESFYKEQHTIIGFTEGLRGTQFNRQSMMSMYGTEKNRLESIKPNPYFAKFEFQNNDSDSVESIYIGKRSLVDDNFKNLVYDWRSDLCSMYYDYAIGDHDAHYDEAGTIKNGVINSKRQIKIKDGNLISVTDQDVLSDDEFLAKSLSETSDSRLKSIIATIQKEQNKIIRNNIDSNYIVQGVAGSGKTTIALHRIAYLLYKEAKKMDISNYMIIGPNRFFLEYISSILPDLDIQAISQSTFEEIFINNIKGRINIKSKNDELETVMQNADMAKVLKYKSSKKYMELIEEFVNLYVSGKLNTNIEIEGFSICSKEKLSSLMDSYYTNSYKERFNSFVKKITKSIKESYEDIYYEATEPLRIQTRKLDQDDPKRKEIFSKLDDLRKDFKQGCNKQLKNFFKFVDVSPIDLYYTFIENLNQFTDDDVELLRKTTLDDLHNKKISSSDMAGILLIQYMMCGCKDYSKYMHLIVDEAQDLSYSQYYILKKMFPNSNFDLFGDINQSIYTYQSIDNWDELNNFLFNGNANCIELDKGYRTTKEISDVSNMVLTYLNQKNATCVSRNGSKAEVHNISNQDKKEVRFGELNELLNSDYKNIAIICKNRDDVNNVHKELKKLPFDIKKILYDNDKYEEGICVLPSYLAKGLEFDAVILDNASSSQYRDSLIEQRLLYVALTRAMHKVVIDYNNEISKSLNGISLDNSKQLIKK